MRLLTIAIFTKFIIDRMNLSFKKIIIFVEVNKKFVILIKFNSKLKCNSLNLD
jgi:hypothetical protein